MSSNEDILRELREIKTELADLKKITGRMDGHISFVERVFDVVRVPFFTIMGAAKYMIPQSAIDHDLQKSIEDDKK
jgi:hypothetical protein